MPWYVSNMFQYASFVGKTPNFPWRKAVFRVDALVFRCVGAVAIFFVVFCASNVHEHVQHDRHRTMQVYFCIICIKYPCIFHPHILYTTFKIRASQAVTCHGGRREMRGYTSTLNFDIFTSNLTQKTVRNDSFLANGSPNVTSLLIDSCNNNKQHSYNINKKGRED